MRNVCIIMNTHRLLPASGDDRNHNILRHRSRINLHFTQADNPYNSIKPTNDYKSYLTFAHLCYTFQNFVRYTKQKELMCMRKFMHNSSRSRLKIFSGIKILLKSKS